MTQVVTSAGTDDILGRAAKKKKKPQGPTGQSVYNTLSEHDRGQWDQLIAKDPVRYSMDKLAQMQNSRGIPQAAQTAGRSPEMGRNDVVARQSSPVLTGPTDMGAVAGAPTAGMTDAERIRQQAASQSQGLLFDRLGLEQELIGETEREAQDARERLARQYGIDPGGADSGMSQRSFETLEGEVLGAKAGIRTSLRQQESEERRANLAALQGLYGTMAGTDIAEAGVTGDYEGEETVAAKEQREASEARKAGLTGKYGDVETIQQQIVDLDAKIAEADRTGLWDEKSTLEAQKVQLQRELQASEIAAKTAELVGFMTAGDGVKFDTLAKKALDMQEAALTGTWNGDPTVAKAAQDFAQAIMKAELTGELELDGETLDTLQKAAQDFNQALEKAGLTGELKLPGEEVVTTLQKDLQDFQKKIETAGITGEFETEDGTVVDTLQKILAKAEFTGDYVDDSGTLNTLQKELQNFQKTVEQAKLTGEYTDEAGNTVDTLQKQLQDAQIDIQNAQLDLDRTEFAAMQARFLMEQTGVVAQNGEISAESLGIDVSQVYDEEGNYNVDAFQKVADKLQMAADILGIEDLTEEQIADLLEGKGISTDRTLTLAARQQLIDSARDMTKVQLDAKIAEAAATGKWEDESTLEMMRYNTATELEQEQMRLEWTQELNREREARAAQTGSYGGTLGPQDLGLPEYTLDSMGYWTDNVVSRFEAAAGRLPTEEEINALTRGQKINLDGRKTIAQQRLELEESIARAEQTGSMIDPVTGQDVATLRSKQLTFEQDLLEQQQRFQEKMDLAEQTGYITVGTDGQITAEDLGVGVEYASILPGSGAQLASAEAQLLKEKYQSMTGKTLTNSQVLDLIAGRSIDSGVEEVRIETVAAKSRARELALQEGSVLGELYGKQTQAAYEFEQTLKNQTDLTEAEIAQIHSNIDIADRQMRQKVFEFAKTSALSFAEVMGTTGGTGSLSASDLGVLISDDMQMQEGETLDEWEARVTDGPEVAALRETLEALGEDISTDQMMKLLQGESIEVKGQKTLGALSLAAQVSQQSLERASDMAKFADQHDLDTNKFTQSVAEFDKTYALQAKQVAQQYNLDVDKFMLAKSEIDTALSGRLGVDGPVSLGDMGLTAPLAPGAIGPQTFGYTAAELANMSWQDRAEVKSAIQDFAKNNPDMFPEGINSQQMDTLIYGGTIEDYLDTSEEQQQGYQEEYNDYLTRIKNRFSMLAGRQPDEYELASLLDGDPVQVASAPSFTREQWAAQVSQVADRYDLDVDAMKEGIRQFDRNMALSEANTYAQIYGTDKEDPTKHTMAYQQYLDAKTQFDETETERDFIWQQMMNKKSDRITASYNMLLNEGVVSEIGINQAIEAVAPDYMKTAEDLGVTKTADVSGVLESAGGQGAQSLGQLLESSPLTDTATLNDSGALVARPGKGAEYQQLIDYTYIYSANPSATFQAMREALGNASYDTDALTTAFRDATGYYPPPDFLNVLASGEPVSTLTNAVADQIKIDYLRDALTERYGYPVSEEQLVQLVGDPTAEVAFTVPDVSMDDLAQMANFVNSHTMSVSNNNHAGGGLATLAGTLVGGTVGFIVGSPGGPAAAATGMAMGANAGATGMSRF